MLYKSQVIIQLSTAVDLTVHAFRPYAPVEYNSKHTHAAYPIYASMHPCSLGACAPAWVYGISKIWGQDGKSLKIGTKWDGRVQQAKSAATHCLPPALKLAIDFTLLWRTPVSKSLATMCGADSVALYSPYCHVCCSGMCRKDHGKHL